MKFKTESLTWGYWSLLAMLCVVYAWRPLEGGYDYWAHAAIGKWIWLNQAIPRETLFIWSEPGTSWVAHSWLSELFFFSLLTQGGPVAVAVFNAAMVVATFFILWRLWKQEGTYTFWVPMIFALAIWISAPRFQPRQELISALFLALLLTFLIAWEKGRFDELRKPGLVLIAIAVGGFFALWVNLHALVAVGLLVLATAVLGNYAQTRFSGLAQDRVLRQRMFWLAVLGIVGLAATLCNPYGWGYWKAADQLKPNNMAKFIEEWKPLWVAPVMFEYLAALFALGLLALLAWLGNPQRRWSGVLWILLSVALTLRSRRMLWMAAILFIAVMAANARSFDTPALWKKWRKLIGDDPEEAIPNAMRLIARVGALICLAAWVLSGASRHTSKDAGNWNAYVRNVPEGAVQFLRPRAKTLRIFNDYEDSSYFQWRLNGELSTTASMAGNLPLYIDLLNAYPDSLMYEYLDILDAKPEALQKLEQRKVNCIVLGEHHWKKPLVSLLDRPGSDWRPMWSDKQSKIWMKKEIDVD